MLYGFVLHTCGKNALAAVLRFSESCPGSRVFLNAYGSCASSSFLGCGSVVCGSTVGPLSARKGFMAYVRVATLPRPTAEHKKN